MSAGARAAASSTSRGLLQPTQRCACGVVPPAGQLHSLSHACCSQSRCHPGCPTGCVLCWPAVTWCPVASLPYLCPPPVCRAPAAPPFLWQVADHLPRPLGVGQRVVARHPSTRQLHDGSVLTVAHNCYRSVIGPACKGGQGGLQIYPSQLQRRPPLPATPAGWFQKVLSGRREQRAGRAGRACLPRQPCYARSATVERARQGARRHVCACTSCRDLAHTRARAPPPTPHPRPAASSLTGRSWAWSWCATQTSSPATQPRTCRPPCCWGRPACCSTDAPSSTASRYARWRRRARWRQLGCPQQRRRQRRRQAHRCQHRQQQAAYHLAARRSLARGLQLRWPTTRRQQQQGSSSRRGQRMPRR